MRHQEQQLRPQQLLQLWRLLKQQLLEQPPRLCMPAELQQASGEPLQQQHQAMVLLPKSVTEVGPAVNPAMEGRGAQQRGLGTLAVRL